MFEQYLDLLVAHIEVVVLDLLDALLELSQGHHFCAFRIYQLLEGLLSQISALSKLLSQLDELTRNELHLRYPLDLSEELSVFQSVDVQRIQHILEHSLFLGLQFDTDLVERSVHVLLKECTEVLDVQGLEYRPNCEALILGTSEPFLDLCDKFFHIADFSVISFALECNRLTDVLECAVLFVVEDYCFHLAAQDYSVILKFLALDLELFVCETSLISVLNRVDRSLESLILQVKFLSETFFLHEVFFCLMHLGLTVNNQLLLRCKFFSQRLDLDIGLLQILLCLFGSIGSYSELIVGLLQLFIMSLFGLVHHYGVHL